jgi:thioredoxin reductase (NADPH)
MKEFDVIIIGGGPAGLSAAVYTSRFLRSTLLIDKHDGRWNTYEHNHNYLGFPEGVLTRTLREKGLEQAQKYGTEYVIEEVKDIQKVDDGFLISVFESQYKSRCLILATGVTDIFPHFEQWQECIGNSIFWCITCDGYETLNKKMIVTGTTDEAACDALQFLCYTKDIVFVTNSQEHEISHEFLERLEKHNIKFIHEKITDIIHGQGVLKEIKLETQSLRADRIFCEEGSVPNNVLANNLGVKLNEIGFIEVDHEQRTNIPFVYAAGDICAGFENQIATAVHTGSIAAQSANYDLYEEFQKMEGV